MDTAKASHTKRTENICDICRSEIAPGEDYLHASKTLCENCYLDVRTRRVRKTHWQYLRSIKSGYLIPGQKGRR